MANLSQLMALLEIDDQGEQIASLLNHALIDDRKRQVLLARLRELEDDMRVVEQDIVLTQSEREVLVIVQDAMKPTTTAEVQSLAKGRSLREYRQHTSAALNALVGKGLLGKVSLSGRQVYFAPVARRREARADPARAVAGRIRPAADLIHDRPPAWSGLRGCFQSLRLVLARIHRFIQVDGVRTAEGCEGVTGAIIRA